VGKRCDRTSEVKADSRRGSSLEVLLVYDGLDLWCIMVREIQTTVGVHLGILMVIALVQAIHEGVLFQGN
jgi:hypothetical protein